MTLKVDKVLQKLDEAMGKLQSMEQDLALQMGKYESIGDLEDKVDELEKRVKILERGNL